MIKHEAHLIATSVYAFYTVVEGYFEVFECLK